MPDNSADIGHNKEYTTSLIMGAVSNAIANFLLIPRFLGVGAAIGSVLAEFVVMFTQYLFVRGKLKVHALKSFCKFVVASAVKSVVVVFLGNILGARILTKLLQAMVGVIVNCAVLVDLKEETVYSAIGKIKEKLKRS